MDGLVQAPASCGVDAMDDEHEICTASFNRALKDPSLEHLQELYELLRAHFQHEEELIAQYSAETPERLASPFSVLSSHRKDHTRILTIAVRELQRIGLGGEAAATTAADGCTPSGWRRPAAVPPPPPSPDTVVDKKVIENLVQAFHIHADTFDALYHNTIPAGAQ